MRKKNCVVNKSIDFNNKVCVERNFASRNSQNKQNIFRKKGIHMELMKILRTPAATIFMHCKADYNKATAVLFQYKKGNSP